MAIDYIDVDALDNEILKCKHYRSHAWDDNPAVNLAGLPTVRYALYVIASVCTRCGRERIEYIDRKGYRIGHLYYRNPVDYPRTHLLRGDDIRVELISRSLLIRSAKLK